MKHRPFRFSKGLSLNRPVHRLPKLVEVDKAVYTLEGGPFDGSTMPLTDGTTIVFKVTRKVNVGLLQGYQPRDFHGCYRTATVGRAGRFKGTAKWCPNVEEK